MSLASSSGLGCAIAAVLSVTACAQGERAAGPPLAPGAQRVIVTTFVEWPSAGEVAGFFENALDGLADVLAAETGDGAEGALVVATFADLEIGAPRLASAGSGGDVRPEVLGWGDLDEALALCRDAWSLSEAPVARPPKVLGLVQ